MLPGELGEIPTTDDAINCNNTTWIIKYLPKSRVIFSSPQWLGKRGDFKNMEEVITRMETFGVMESKNPSVDCPYGYIVFIYRDGTRKVVPKDYSLDQRIRIQVI